MTSFSREFSVVNLFVKKRGGGQGPPCRSFSELGACSAKEYNQKAREKTKQVRERKSQETSRGSDKNIAKAEKGGIRLRRDFFGYRSLL